MLEEIEFLIAYEEFRVDLIDLEDFLNRIIGRMHCVNDRFLFLFGEKIYCIVFPTSMVGGILAKRGNHRSIECNGIAGKRVRLKELKIVSNRSNFNPVLIHNENRIIGNPFHEFNNRLSKLFGLTKRKHVRCVEFNLIRVIWASLHVFL